MSVSISHGRTVPKNKKTTKRTHFAVTRLPMVDYTELFKFDHGKVTSFLRCALHLQTRDAGPAANCQIARLKSCGTRRFDLLKQNLSSCPRKRASRIFVRYYPTPAGEGSNRGKLPSFRDSPPPAGKFACKRPIRIMREISLVGKRYG